MTIFLIKKLSAFQKTVHTELEIDTSNKEYKVTIDVQRYCVFKIVVGNSDL